MSDVEIDLAREYLAATEQDPIAALIWAVKDLARARRMTPATRAEFHLVWRDGVAASAEIITLDGHRAVIA